MTENPFRLYRPGRLAKLLGVHPSTIWKWRVSGKLPAPVEIGRVRGWTEQQLSELLQQPAPSRLRSTRKTKRTT